MRTYVRQIAAHLYGAALATYGKAQYDKSKDNVWAGPTRRSLGNVGTSVALALPPYSVSVLTLK